ncbi:MAG TPA: hypothetical protein VNB22_06080 [Pyrinomonadaceae bacterium]|jgi:hypothetical protein|nr:hypothetical protein [Pyrinomonadaceae bacterium]
MKNFVCLLLILTAVGITFGQKTFEVQDFSKDYYGKVFLKNPSEVFSQGWVAVYEKKTNRQLIKITSEQLTGDFEDGKIKANVKELPYGEQSVIIYDDFNFDGVKDFALMDGQNSCYGGPSFQIYLAGKSKARFVFSQSFTRLAQDYCGMFDIDKSAKKISTMTKSGCCWHQFSEFIVVNNTPKAVKIVEDDAMNFPFSTISTEIWNGKRMVKTSDRKIDFENDELKVLFSFLTKTNNQVILFSYGDQLYYAYINQKENVEFAFPVDSKQENPMFTIDSKANPTALSFINKSVNYKVYETADGKIGVQVNAAGKLSDISGDKTSQKGSLQKLAEANLTNITLK